MLDSIQSALPYATAVLFLLAILLLLVSMRMFKRSRTDVFWRKRRQAGQRGWRIFVLAFVLMITSALACTATLVTGVLTDDGNDADIGETVSAEDIVAAGSTPDDLPTPTASTIIAPDRSPTLEDLSPVATDAVSPTESVAVATTSPEVIIITTTPVVTPTHTPYPTFTPFATPLMTNVTPGPDAQLTIVALDDQISDQFKPVNPRTSFAEGTTRIYLFVEFRGMTEDVLWRLDLYHNGAFIEGNSYLWGGETEGDDYFFIGDANGFQPGVYEIRVFIDESENPVSAMRFMVEETS